MDERSCVYPLHPIVLGEVTVLEPEVALPQLAPLSRSRRTRLLRHSTIGQVMTGPVPWLTLGSTD